MPRPESLLLDTHILLWWQAGGHRLSRRARSALDEAARVLVSPLTCWEVALLVAKGRIGLDRPTVVWCNDVLSGDRVELAELSPLAAIMAGEYDGMHGDPVDRMLYATAGELKVPLVSKDRLLHDFASRDGRVQVLW